MAILHIFYSHISVFQCAKCFLPCYATSTSLKRCEIRKENFLSFRDKPQFYCSNWTFQGYSVSSGEARNWIQMPYLYMPWLFPFIGTVCKSLPLPKGVFLIQSLSFLPNFLHGLVSFEAENNANWYFWLFLSHPLPEFTGRLLWDYALPGI